MSWVSLTAIACFLWLRFRSTRFPLPAIAGYRPSPRVALACALALVALFYLQTRILLYQVRSEMPPGRGVTSLPFPVYDATSYDASVHQSISYLALGIGGCEFVALACLALAVAQGLPRAGLLLTPVVGALAAIALATPALSTTDPYEYAATSLLGFAAYAPPPHAFDATVYDRFARIVPLRGVIYGPLWVALDTFALAWIPAIAAKIFALRALNTLLIAVLALLFARAKVAKATTVALVANPAVWYYVVLNPHADIEGLVVLAGAYLCARRARPLIAMSLLAAAGLIKISFLVAGAAALAPLENPRKRIAAFAGAVLLTVIGSALVPHEAYLRDLFVYAPHAASVTGQIHGSQLWLVAAALAVLGSAALLVARLRFAPVAWLFAQLAPYGAPWYLLWGLPYATATGTATALLVTLPVAAAALDPSFDVFPLPMLALLGVALGVAADVLRTHVRTRIDAVATTKSS